MVSKEFFEALADLEAEKGISSDIFIDALRNALISAYKKQYDGGAGDVDIRINPEKNSIKYYTVRTAVEEVTDKEKEISLAEAQLLKKSYKAGDLVYEEFVPKDFGRIAAQTAKQVILQKLHEIERDNTLSEFSDKKDELMSCVVRKVDAKNVYVELGKGQIEGIMLPQDQVPGEKYEVNDRLKVYVKNIKSSGRGAQVLVSRASAGLVLSNGFLKRKCRKSRQGQSSSRRSRARPVSAQRWRSAAKIRRSMPSARALATKARA